jgi:ParB family chromosome partitioning protein
MTYEIKQIPTDDIKFFVRRARGGAAYARLKQSIGEIGLKTPIGVREISGRSKKERRRPNGGYYQFELVYGQGRLQAFRDLGLDRIPAIEVDVTEQEIVGRFLAENVMRRSLSWREKAKLIEYDIRANGLSVEDVASRYCITPLHAKKYLRLLRLASDKILRRAEAGEIDMMSTEKLATLPKDTQDIVVEVLDEEGLDKSAIMHLVDEAARIRRNGNGKVTKDKLKGSLSDLNNDLRSIRERLKVKRLEFALGPEHLFRLMADSPEFVARVSAAGLDLSTFAAR